MSEAAAEERYRAFIENSTEGIWRCDLEEPISTALSEDEQIDAFYRQGFLAEANDAFARMYGFSRGEDLVGARLGDLLVRDDPANTEYLRAFIRAHYRLTDVESVERDREGHVRHFSNTLTGIVQGDLLVRAWGTQRDTTAQKQLEAARNASEDALRESEQRFRALADNIAQLAWLGDASGALFWYNRRWFEYTGTALEEMQGWGWQKVHHPDFVAAVIEKFQAHVRTGEPWEDTFPLRGADGEYRWFLSRAFPIRDTAGSIVLWCGTNTDITEQREAAVRQRRFLREMLAGFTEGRLRLCDSPEHLPPPLPPLDDPVALSERPMLRQLRQQIDTVMDRLEMPAERKGDLQTASHEAAMNALLHGGGGLARLHGDPTRGRIQVWVTDDGPGIAEDMIHRAVERGFTTGGFGQGFFYMQSCADRLYLLSEAGKGTTVVLEMDRTAPEPSWLQSVR